MSASQAADDGRSLAGGQTTDFDQIGSGYSEVRKPDRRLAAEIAKALGHADRILNIGAGAGSYEPVGKEVVAVEPSSVMLSQHGGHRRVQAVAEALPFGAGHFDASMATLTVHHWSDLVQGLTEMRRVSRRQVVFTWDPDHDRPFWLHSDYMPELGAFERSRFPTLAQVVDLMDADRVIVFALPHDFSDGFQHAFWRRPEAFLDPRVRAASSMFAVLAPGAVEPALERLRADLDSGVWARRHEDLLAREAVDYGFRLIVAGDDS